MHVVDQEEILSDQVLPHTSIDLTNGSKNIPLHILQNKYNQPNYVGCISQNGHKYGFLPLSPLRIYTGDPTYYESIPDIIKLHHLVRSSSTPNYLKCRIPLQTQLNIKNWRKYLSQYWDKQLPDLLEYGFPLDFDRSRILQSTEINHTSALQHPQEVSRYIDEELQFSAIYGPFEQKPFALHVSPLMTREKADSNSRRTIMDLSWPHDFSINAGVSKDIYLDTYFELHYPSIDDIVHSIKYLGPSSKLFKVDISRAFRHLRVDPGDLDLLGFKYGQYYVDGSTPFGYRHGSVFFQRCSDAIRYIMKTQGHPNLINYIDDLIYIGLPSKIDKAFNDLLCILRQLGLDISQKKLVAPSTSAICLGILINTVDRTISIPAEKLKHINHICNEWKSKVTCTKNQLQSLLGSLLYISKCVKPARFFLNRMLQFLRDNNSKKMFKLHDDFYKDLNWFLVFLQSYNGVTFYDNKPPAQQVFLDASLTGLGGTFAGMVYALSLPPNFRNYNIVHLEILNVMVALKIWGHVWKDCHISIFCDNMAVIQVLNSGRTKDMVLAACARNIWMLSAIYNVQLSVNHIMGEKNRIADLLSRWDTVHNREQKLQCLVNNPIWVLSHIDLTEINYHI